MSAVPQIRDNKKNKKSIARGWDPIFELTYSYYRLLQPALQPTQGTMETNEIVTEAGDDYMSFGYETEENDNQALWTPYEWTPDEHAQALGVLTEHAEKCVASLAVRRQLPTDTQAWDKFYRRHQTNFFKDRHYLATAFPNEFTTTSNNSRPIQRTLCEIGKYEEQKKFQTKYK
jgi:hypothetical protein